MEPVTREEIDNWLDLFGDPNISQECGKKGAAVITAYLDKLEVELMKAKGQKPLEGFEGVHV